jgi:ADP-ribose pyrophosphatase
LNIILAVAILAILTGPNFPLSTIIIEQFRPPVNAYVIELPAGLIDPKETIESTAFRELEEETGYKAESLLEVSTLMVCDPGGYPFEYIGNPNK